MRACVSVYIWGRGRLSHVDHVAAESINLTKTVHALLQVGEEVAELMRKAARELDVPASYHHHHQQQGAK